MVKGLTIDDFRVSRGTVFQDTRPGAGFETGDFVREKLVGGLPLNDSALQKKMTFGDFYDAAYVNRPLRFHVAKKNDQDRNGTRGGEGGSLARVATSFC